MKKSELINSVLSITKRAGFHATKLTDSPGMSFDIIARRDELLLIFRVVPNIDSLTKEMCSEVKFIAKHLKASLLIVGERSTSRKIKPGIVHSRYSIPAINLDSLTDLFYHGINPFSHSAHGGFYVEIDGETLRRARMERKLSLGTIAQEAGVSKRAIQMYETGMDVSIETAFRLEDFLRISLIRSRDVLTNVFDEVSVKQRDLSQCRPFEKEIFSALQRIGTPAVPIFKCPFNALTGENLTTTITSISEQDRKMKRRAEIISKISRISERPSLIIIEKKTNAKSINGVPVFGKKEIVKVRDAEEFEEMKRERSS